jgi:hypothetical protein
LSEDRTTGEARSTRQRMEFGWVPAFVLVVSIIVLVLGAAGLLMALLGMFGNVPLYELQSGQTSAPSNLFSAIAFGGICIAPGIMGSIISAYLLSMKRRVRRGETQPRGDA